MFDIPTEMRELAEKNVEQARVAYGQFMEFMSQAMNAWSSSGAPEAGNFKALQERAVAFAKENAERSFALASDLAKAAEPLRPDPDADLRHPGSTTLLVDGRRLPQHAGEHQEGLRAAL